MEDKSGQGTPMSPLVFGPFTVDTNVLNTVQIFDNTRLFVNEMVF